MEIRCWQQLSTNFPATGPSLIQSKALTQKHGQLSFSSFAHRKCPQKMPTETEKPESILGPPTVWVEGSQAVVLCKSTLAFPVQERQQSQDAGLFDGAGEGPLLFGGQTRDPSRQNFAALGDVLPQQIYIFIINGIAWFDRRQPFAIKAHVLSR